jgi:hypothetical protein
MGYMNETRFERMYVCEDRPSNKDSSINFSNQSPIAFLGPKLQMFHLQRH